MRFYGNRLCGADGGDVGVIEGCAGLGFATEAGAFAEEGLNFEGAEFYVGGQGKPIVRGTRIAVELMLEKLAAGESEEQLLRAHARLTREAIHAALAFAAGVVYRVERVAS